MGEKGGETVPPQRLRAPMFLLRSAFWLTVAFIALAPHGVDLRGAAGEMSADALAAGQRLIVGQILSADCHTLQCTGGKAILTAVAGTASPSVDTTMQDSSNAPVPFPRPRPDRMG